MMLFRRSAQIALHASLLLALEPTNPPRRVRDLAGDLKVGTTYLAKVLQNLTRAGLLRGARGPGGGVHLARPAHEITPWDVLAAVEPEGEFDRCVLGFDGCSSASPCPLHEGWTPIRAQILNMLKDTSLRTVALEAKRKGVLRSERPQRSGQDSMNKVSGREP